MGGGGPEESESEGWSRESRGSNATSDAGTEEDEVEHALLTVLPWGTQESGARGLRGDARAGRSNGGKGTSATADGEDAGSPWGAKRTRWGKGRPPGLGMCRPLGSGRKLSGPRGLWSGPQSPRSGMGGGGREASGVEKTPERVRQGVEGGVESSQDDLIRHGKGGGSRVMEG